jgi:CPA1 family monovalent cation:H+ antiporter
LHGVEIILGLLLAVVVLAWVASRLNIPYPILLVIGGLALALVPGLPRVGLRPDVVFLVFLPPILYYAALLTSWRDFKANLRPISLLAIGLVLFTTCLVAAVAHWLIGGMSWATAFVLGAIVSPPDAVAATAIAQRLRVPKRVVTILEGESLVNDAAALIAYRVAVGVVAGTSLFSGRLSFVGGTFGQFVIAAVGGVAVGLLAGVVMAWIRPRVRDASVETSISLLTPYVAYLPAEWLHLSSVLAVVTCGLYISRRLNQITSARVRLRAYAAWDALVFLLNGLIFILIGLQLRNVIGGLDGLSVAQAARYAAVISLVAVAVRMVWVFPATYLPRMLVPALRRRDPSPPWQAVFVIAWTGMRGIVSLAAALALPLYLADGVTRFPHRDLIIFITFGVILVTLVFQGLTLPLVIRWLRLAELADDGESEEETMARYLGALAAVERLDDLTAVSPAAKERLGRVRATYDDRVAYFSRQLSPPGDGDGNGIGEDVAAQVAACETGEQIEREALAAERQMLNRLRDQGVIGDEVLRRIQEELDHEESRLSE